MKNNFRKDLREMDGRHKLACIAALIAWGVSIYFSQAGFSLESPNAQFLGWILAGIVTVVELVFNSRAQKLSLTLIITGILCYLYGVWTNVTGFWNFQHPGEIFAVFSQHSILSWFVGSILEILPEPLFMWGIGAKMEGDLLGNILGLWSGELNYAQPHNSNFVEPPVKVIYHPKNSPGTQKSNYKAKHRPQWKNQNQPQTKGQPESQYHPIGMSHSYDPSFMKATGYGEYNEEDND